MNNNYSPSASQKTKQAAALTSSGILNREDANSMSISKRKTFKKAPALSNQSNQLKQVSDGSGALELPPTGEILFTNSSANKIKAKSKQLSSNTSNHSLHRRNITVVQDGQSAFQAAYGNVILPLDFATPSEVESHKIRLKNLIPLGQSPPLNFQKNQKAKFFTNMQASGENLRVVSMSSFGNKNSLSAAKKQEAQLILQKSNPQSNLPDIKHHHNQRQEKNKKTRNMILIQSNSLYENGENSRYESQSPSMPNDILKLAGKNGFLYETQQPDQLQPLQLRNTMKHSPSQDNKYPNKLRSQIIDEFAEASRQSSDSQERRIKEKGQLRGQYINQKSFVDDKSEGKGQIRNDNNNSQQQNQAYNQNEEQYSQIEQQQQQQTPRMKSSNLSQKNKKLTSETSLINSREKISPQYALASSYQSPSSQKQLLSKLLHNSSHKSSFVAAEESKINLTLDSNESPQQVIFEFQKQIKKNIRTLSNVPPIDSLKKDLLVMDPNYKIQDERYNHYYNVFNNENIKPQNINGGNFHTISGPQQHSSGMAVLKPPLYQNSILNSTGSFVLNNDSNSSKINEGEAKVREIRTVQHQKGVKSIDNLSHLNNYLTNKKSLPLQNQIAGSNYQQNSIILSPQLNISNSLSHLQQSPNGRRSNLNDSPQTAASSFLPQIKSAQNGSQMLNGSQAPTSLQQIDMQKQSYGQKLRETVHHAQMQENSLYSQKNQTASPVVNSVQMSANVEEGANINENVTAESMFGKQYNNQNGRMIQNTSQEPAIEFNHFRIQIPIKAQNSSVIQETLKNQLEYLSSIIKKEEHSNNGSNHSSNGGAHSHNNSQHILGGQGGGPIQQSLSQDSYQDSYFKRISQEQEGGLPMTVPQNSGPGLIMIQKYIVSNHFNKADGPPVSSEQQIIHSGQSPHEGQSISFQLAQKNGNINAQNQGAGYQLPSQFSQGSNFNFTPQTVPDVGQRVKQNNSSPPHRKKSKSRMSGIQNSGGQLTQTQSDSKAKKGRNSLTNPQQKQSLLESSPQKDGISVVEDQINERDQQRLMKLQQILTSQTPQIILSGQLLSQSQLGELQNIESQEVANASPSATPLSINMRSDLNDKPSATNEELINQMISRQEGAIMKSPQYIKFEQQSPHKLLGGSKKNSRTQFEVIISSDLHGPGQSRDQEKYFSKENEQVSVKEGALAQRDQSRPDSSIWMVTNESLDDDTSVELVGEQVYMREKSLMNKKSQLKAQSSSEVVDRSINPNSINQVQSSRHQKNQQTNDRTAEEIKRDWDIRQSDTNMFSFPNDNYSKAQKPEAQTQARMASSASQSQRKFEEIFQPEPESPSEQNKLLKEKDSVQNTVVLHQKGQAANSYLTQEQISIVKRQSETIEDYKSEASRHEDLASVRRRVEELAIQSESRVSQQSPRDQDTKLVGQIDYKNYLESQMPTEIKNSVQKIIEEMPIKVEGKYTQLSEIDQQNDSEIQMKQQIKSVIQQEIKKRFSFNDIEANGLIIDGDIQRQIENLNFLQNSQRSDKRAFESPRVDQKPPSRTKKYADTTEGKNAQESYEDPSLDRITNLIHQKHLTQSDQNPMTLSQKDSQGNQKQDLLQKITNVMLHKINTLDMQKQSVGSFKTGHFNQSPSDSLPNKTSAQLSQSHGSDPFKKSPLPLAKKVTIKGQGFDSDKGLQDRRASLNGIQEKEEEFEKIENPLHFSMAEATGKVKEKAAIKSILKKFSVDLPRTGSSESNQLSQTAKKPTFEGEIMIQDENIDQISQPSRIASNNEGTEQLKQISSFKRPRVIISSSEIEGQEDQQNQMRHDFSKLPPRVPSPTYLNPASALNSGESSEPKQMEAKDNNFENLERLSRQETASVKKSSGMKRSLGQGNRSTLELVQQPESMIQSASLMSQKTQKDIGKSRNKDTKSAIYSQKHQQSLESFEHDKSLEDCLDENEEKQMRTGSDIFNKTAPYSFNLLKLDLHPSSRSNIDESKKSFMLRLDSFKHKLVSKEVMLSRQKTNTAKTDSIVTKLKQGMKRNIIDEYNEEKEKKEQDEKARRQNVIMEFNTVNNEEEEKKRQHIQTQIQSKLDDIRSNDLSYKKEKTRRKSVKKVVKLSKKPPTSGMSTSNADKLKQTLKRKEQDQAELRKLEKMKIKEQFLQKKQANNFLAPGQDYIANASNSETKQQSLRVSDSFTSPGLQLKLAMPSGQNSTHPSQTYSFKQQYGQESAVGNSNKQTLSNILSQASSTKRSSNPIHRNQYE